MFTTNFTQDQIREINRVKIIQWLRAHQTGTKQEISSEMQLSIPTVTSIVQVLVEEGLAEEAGLAVSTGGRKPKIVRFLPDARHALGVNISTEAFQILLLNLNQETVDREDAHFKAGETFDRILERVLERVEAMLARNGISKESLLGMGMALPGLVDDDRQVLSYAPNLGVRDHSFQEFQERLGMKLFIENEANVAAYGEQLAGAARNKGNLVYVSVTEGVGTGIIIENHIYKSNRKKAGEFGHIPITDGQEKCNCGRTGCWELFTSKNALIRYYGEEGGTGERSVPGVFEAYRNGEQAAQAALERYTRYLYQGLDNILLALNPDFVVLGGDLGDYAGDVIELGSRLELDRRFYGYEQTPILPSELHGQGALMGAALLSLEEVFNYKKNVI
ncbi:ROK family protein [Anaerotalea alkaliphila]|uniref:ROK family protein n=1 Tax=Anaerotalea alkaliphila TaxID=2662126 RepID=A0A7X5HXP4_9FIRM|nr:ROK family protein [Anaerotalea alkaliphila]NDL68574.1 ROK family protein [Anaerotalea alkaliphila]